MTTFFFEFRVKNANFNFCEVILSLYAQNKCSDDTNAMQNTLLSGEKLMSFGFQVKQSLLWEFKTAF